MNVKSIRNLVAFALADRANVSAQYIFSKLPRSQAQRIEKLIGVDLTGAPRLIDTSGIRHALRKHGNAVTEARRGNIAINTYDFEKIPSVLANPDEVKYGGKNSLNQDVFVFEKRIDNLYFVVEAIRFSKSGNKLVMQTLYKKK